MIFLSDMAQSLGVSFEFMSIIGCLKDGPHRVMASCFEAARERVCRIYLIQIQNLRNYFASDATQLTIKGNKIDHTDYEAYVYKKDPQLNCFDARV